MSEPTWLNEETLNEGHEDMAAVATMPRFDELTVFGQSEDMAASTVETLLEKYSKVESYVIAKKWVAMFEVVESTLKPLAINDTNEKKTEVVLGGKTVATVSERAMPRKYTYIDSTLADMEVRKAKLDTEIKERKKFLESLKSNVADADTGEIIQPAVMLECGMTIAVKYI